MANTKKLPRNIRKGIKRSMRKKLHELYASLTSQQRKKWLHAEEKMGIKQYVNSLKKQEGGEK